MILGRLVAVYGAVPIAVQKVGSQIESISWMTAGGFSTALGAFVGQNYGAKQYERIQKGYRTTLMLALGQGDLRPPYSSLLVVLFLPSFYLKQRQFTKEQIT